jgi:uncharacterized tellurite resistance protein B-like protein
MGGALRPSDVRRYLIEAMVGAMHADGVIHPREMEAVRALLERHDLFAALTWPIASMLIELSTDAIAFAGDARKRVGVLASRLPSRTHRLAAYSMACEVCAADDDIAESELSYLEALRAALHISEREHLEILQAAREDHSMLLLEAKAAHTREMLPVVIRALLVRRRQQGAVDESTGLELCELLCRLRDIDLPPADVASAVDRELSSLRPRRTIEAEVVRLAVDLPERADRFWLITYLLESAYGVAHRNWREVDFFQMLRVALGLSPEDMEAAQACARAARPE